MNESNGRTPFRSVGVQCNQSMWTARTVVVLALVLCSAVAGGLVAADPLDPLTDTHHDRGPAVEPQTNGTMNGSDVGRNDSLGGEISSFMQITAASAEGAVDSGMWRASINDSTSGTEQDAAIAARIDYLWKQFDSIQAEKADLRRDRNNNTSVSYVARASRLAARIDAFRTAVNQTAELAAERNVSGTEMARLEAAAAGLGTVDIPAVDEELETGPTTTSGPSPSPTATPTSTSTPASTETPTATPTQTATAEPTTTETDTSTPTETPTPETTNATTPTQTPPPTDPPTSTTTPPTTEDSTDEVGGNDGDDGDDSDGSDDSEGDDDSESEGDGDTGADGDGSDDNENESSTSVDDAPGSTTIPPTGTTDTSTTSATSASSEQGTGSNAGTDTVGTVGAVETSVA